MRSTGVQVTHASFEVNNSKTFGLVASVSGGLGVREFTRRLVKVIYRGTEDSENVPTRGFLEPAEPRINITKALQCRLLFQLSKQTNLRWILHAQWYVYPSIPKIYDRTEHLTTIQYDPNDDDTCSDYSEDASYQSSTTSLCSAVNQYLFENGIFQAVHSN